MKFTVACNWDENLLERIRFSEVTSIFGGLPDTVISGGRNSGLINSLGLEAVRAYIKKAHSQGLDFDYNVNSTCLANREFTPQGHQEILNYLESVVALGVDSLTVSIPSLIRMIKKYFPQIKVKVSTFQKIDSVEMARRFEDLGADALMLSEHVNRDFRLIKAIRGVVHSKLILIANVGCIYGCPNMHTHANSIAHSGAKGGDIKNVAIEKYQLECIWHRLHNPVEMIKSRWIRPEDLDFYESLGVDMIKIIERHSTTDALIERVEAYHNRFYAGNLVELLGQMMNAKNNQKMNSGKIMPENDPSGSDRLMKLLRAMNISMSNLIYLDNRKIPSGFLNGFWDCGYKSCEQCGYCHQIAADVITIPSRAKIDQALADIDSFDKELAAVLA